jgi:hypothetical protein
MLPACPTIYPAGTKLANLLDENETATVGAGGWTAPFAVPGTSAKIFAAQSFPLDPVVTGISPAHDAKKVAPVAPIVIRFNRTMDIRSVESAFSTMPPVRGRFSWSPKRDVMTVTLPGQGFPPQTMVTVRIDNTARDAVSGKTFYAGFESRYQCGDAQPAP